MSSRLIASCVVSVKPMLKVRFAQASSRAVRCYSLQGKPTACPDVQKLAELAQIKVTDEEAREWAPQIAEVIEWFGKLEAVDFEGIEPSLLATNDEANVLRPDTPRVFEDRASLISEVPEMEGPYVKVPKVM